MKIIFRVNNEFVNLCHLSELDVPDPPEHLPRHFIVKLHPTLEERGFKKADAL